MDDLTRLGLVDDADITIDEAALTVALVDHPDVDQSPYIDLLETLARRLHVVGLNAANADARADALSQVLGGEFRFIGDWDTYDDPDNADLIRVIDRRRGLPVSLSILYVGAARRIGWTAHVLDVPGHVLVSVDANATNVVIDPFAGGARVRPDRLDQLLASAGRGADGAFASVAPMSNCAVLGRLVHNQASRAEQGGKGRRALGLYRRINLIAPALAYAWWRRAKLEFDDGDAPAAKSSLSALLELTREPALRQHVKAAIEELAVTGR